METLDPRRLKFEGAQPVAQIERRVAPEDVGFAVFHVRFRNRLIHFVF